MERVLISSFKVCCSEITPFDSFLFYCLDPLLGHIDIEILGSIATLDR